MCLPAKPIVKAIKNAATFINLKPPSCTITADDRDAGRRRAAALYLHAMERKAHISGHLLRKLRLRPELLKRGFVRKSRDISEATFRSDHESCSLLAFQP